MGSIRFFLYEKTSTLGIMFENRIEGRYVKIWKNNYYFNINCLMRILSE